MTEEDKKLVYLGWIELILGIPKDLDATKYNELADKFYELNQQSLTRQVKQMREEGWQEPPPGNW